MDRLLGGAGGMKLEVRFLSAWVPNGCQDLSHGFPAGRSTPKRRRLKRAVAQDFGRSWTA